jgi:amino acid transporter
MTATDPAASAAPHLRRNVLGTGGIVFLVVAAAAPLTAMAGVAPLALLVGGVGAPSAYLGAGLVLVIFAIAFTSMTRHVDAAGAFYAYIARGLGKPAGLAAALLALMSYATLQIGVYGLLASQTQATLDDVFHVHVQWPVIAVIGIAVVTAICWYGIELGARLLGVLLVAEALILLVMAVAIVAKGGASGLDLASFKPSALTGPGMAAILGLSFAAFMGFESTAIYRSEARDPERTVPRATYIAVGFMAVFYCFIAWTAVQAFGAAEVQGAAAADLPGMFFTIITTYVGSWAATLMHLLVITSVVASQIAFHNAVTRYALALSAEGALPAALGRIHPRHSSPTTAGLVQSVLAVVVVVAFAVAGADPFTGLLVWVNTPGVVGILILQILTAVAVVVFFVRDRNLDRRVVTIGAGAVAAVLLSAGTYLLIKNIDLLTGTKSTWNWVVLGLVPGVLAAGLAFAEWTRRHRPEVLAAIGQGLASGSAAEAVGIVQDPTIATGTARA